MKLLDPGEIREHRSEREGQSYERVRMLAEEEARLSLSVSAAREESKKEIARIEAVTAEHRKAGEEERNALSQEVETLKGRRTELLKPVDWLLEAARADRRAAESTKSEIELEKKALAGEHERNREGAVRNVERSREIDIRELVVAEREGQADRKKELLGESENKLAADWGIYYKAVEISKKREEGLDVRESNLAVREKAVEDRSGAQDAREKSLRDKQGELESNYAALEQARRHLGIAP